MVHTFFPNMDPILGSLNGLSSTNVSLQAPLIPPGLISDGISSTFSSPSPVAVRLWAKYLSSVDPGLPTVSVPREWMDFFTLLLPNQTSTDWASQFLQSPAWAIIGQASPGNTFLFSLPKATPLVKSSDLSCSRFSSSSF